MTERKRPVVAIAAAKRKARTWGFLVIELVSDTALPIDFAIDDRGCQSIIRVRRLKFAGFSTGTIERNCQKEIAALRAMKVPEGIFRELWVRGPGRDWHRYLILPDVIRELEVRQAGQTDSEDSEESTADPRITAGIAAQTGMAGKQMIPVPIQGGDSHILQ